jgi:GNAT superfamily N-acetyltransferase
MSAVSAPAGVVIREASIDDVPRIVEMGLRFIRETVYAGRIAENPARMAALAEQLIAGSSMFVAEREGVVVGMTGALFFEHPLSGEPFASELFWWVEPEARGSLGVRLLRRLVEWARARGAVALTMIAPTPAVEALYERLGMERVEVSYLRRL